MATVTVGSFSATYLDANTSSVPYGYEGEARYGRTARTWAVKAVLTKAEEATFLGVYNTWRNTRITDEDTLASGVVGTTINFTITGDVGNPVTALPCWFADPPSSEPAGAWRLVSFRMVDAAQALEVLLKEQEASTQDAEEPDLGTLTLGSAVITLTNPLEAYQDVPQVEMLATGNHYITGVPGFTEARNVQGYVTGSTAWEALLTWYESTINSTLSAGAWFPTTPPTATAEAKIVAGVKQTRYNVSLTMVQLR
jgi:hypothetical protein